MCLFDVIYEFLLKEEILILQVDLSHKIYKQNTI
jgi:hypothetical protein